MRLTIAVSALAVACATTPPKEEKISWDEAVGSAASRPAPKFDPREFSSRGLRPEACEAEARAIARDSMDDGWAALKICAKNETFTLLKELTQEPWIEQLSARPDAKVLLLRVVANRGGNIARDLAMLNEHRVPLFPYGAALAQPDVYKGQYVLIRAKVSDIRNNGQATTVKLAEFGLGALAFEHDVGPTYKSGSTYSGTTTTAKAAAGTVSYDTTRYGSGTVKGAYASASKTTSSGSRDSYSKKVETKYDNVSSETGREALGRLPKPDPFLVPEKEFIVLARFDGTRIADDGDVKAMVGVLSIVAYAEPNSLVIN